MADNFRNKQWFKNMSQERKDDICKRFDIDEKTLRKAGRENDNGEIVIDLLRIDHLQHTPASWDTYYDILIKDDCFDSELRWDFTDINDMLLRINHIYHKVNPTVKFKKYSSTVHNNLLVKYAFKHILHWVNEAKYDLNDKDYVKFCCNQIYTHCRVLIESDLNLVKI